MCRGSNLSKNKKFNENMKFLKSVFFLILFIIKYYLCFCNGYLEVGNVFSVQFIFKKTYEWWWQFSHYSNITMKY